ncbi:OsmC family protein [Candidatus Bipolaricaulota bacterium]|nr:OsmC family protein [Candidatus Bipolaricaulota bacterium]
MAPQAVATWKEGMAFTVEVRGHRLESDLSPDKGGKDLGPTPPEILLGALAACSGIYAKMFADREGLPASGIQAVAQADVLQSPMRLGNFSVRVRIPGLPQGKRDKAKAFVEGCMVGQTLKVANTVSLELD